MKSRMEQGMRVKRDFIGVGCWKGCSESVDRGQGGDGRFGIEVGVIEAPFASFKF